MFVLNSSFQKVREPIKKKNIVDIKISVLAIGGILILNVGLAFLLHRLGRMIKYNKRETLAMGSILAAFVLVTFVAAGMSYKTYDSVKGNKQAKKVTAQGEFSFSVLIAQLISSAGSRVRI